MGPAALRMAVLVSLGCLPTPGAIAAPWRLYVIVDGSGEMVSGKEYYSVCKLLATKT